MMEIEMTMQSQADALDGATEDQMPAMEAFAPEVAEPDAAAAPAAGLPATADIPSLEAVYDVPVKVQAILGRSRMPVSELMQLTAGHVVELDRKVGEPVDVFVNDRLIARGEVVMIDNALGVTLTEIVRQDD